MLLPCMTGISIENSRPSIALAVLISPSDNAFFISVELTGIPSTQTLSNIIPPPPYLCISPESCFASADAFLPKRKLYPHTAYSAPQPTTFANEPARTVAYEEPSFDPVGYWRGRTWVNMVYFALRGLKWYGYDGLAEKGRATVLGWMMREPSNFNENYNPLTGRPLGAMYFGWSNAFAIKFVLDWDKPRTEEMPL